MAEKPRGDQCDRVRGEEWDQVLNGMASFLMTGSEDSHAVQCLKMTQPPLGSPWVDRHFHCYVQITGADCGRANP